MFEQSKSANIFVAFFPINAVFHSHLNKFLKQIPIVRQKINFKNIFQLFLASKFDYIMKESLISKGAVQGILNVDPDDRIWTALLQSLVD